MAALDRHQHHRRDPICHRCDQHQRVSRPISCAARATSSWVESPESLPIVAFLSTPLAHSPVPQLARGKRHRQFPPWDIFSRKSGGIRKQEPTAPIPSRVFSANEKLIPLENSTPERSIVLLPVHHQLDEFVIIPSVDTATSLGANGSAGR
jgi:hypothetical protein